MQRKTPLRSKTPLKSTSNRSERSDAWKRHRPRPSLSALENRQKNRCRNRDVTCQALSHGLRTRCAGGLVVHHVHPKGMGGSTNPLIHHLSNLVLLCDHHHRWVHENITLAELLGLYSRVLAVE